MSTIRLRGGLLQTPNGGFEADVLISGDRITALLATDDPTGADTDIDVRGKWVLPGLIDLHAHVRVPGYEYKEDYRTASMAAARGGYTLFVDMPNVEPPTTTVELFEQKKAIASADSLIDYGHFVAPTDIEEIPKFAKAGVSGFKIFQVSGGYPHDPRLSIDDPAQLLDTFAAIAETGLLCVVHPCTQSLLERLYKREMDTNGVPDMCAWSDIYTADVVWRTAVATLLELQRETGVRLQVVHTHAPGSLRLLKQAKLEGVGVTVACDPKYFHLDDQDLEDQGPRALPGGTITSDPVKMRTIWDSVDQGVIDLFDSDHAPHTLQDLESMHSDPLTGAWGSPQYDNLLALLLTDVKKGDIRLARLISMLTEVPAKLLGLYPERGVILPNSYADICVVDPEAVMIPSDEDVYTKAGWTPYKGRKLLGVPILTILRGQIIAKDGKIVGDPEYGQYVTAKPLDWDTVVPHSHQGISLKPRI